VRVTVSAPATSANLGPGFDSFGICLEGPVDTVMARKMEGQGIALTVSGVGAETIPRDARHNTAGRAALAIRKMAGHRGGMEIVLRKGVRPGSGIGSSAASAAAASVAAALLVGGLTVEEMIEAAAEGESASAGEEHADNVAASILGGLTVVRSVHPIEVKRMRPPRSLRLVVALPDLYVSTLKARKLLPEEIPLSSMTWNVARASTLIAAIMEDDIELAGRMMTDEVVEPIRAKLIRGYRAVKAAALRAGAAGVTISGSGPAMLAMLDVRRASPGKVAASMARAFRGVGVGCQTLVSRTGRGVIIDRSAGHRSSWST
jgi:homoserine kinase